MRPPEKERTRSQIEWLISNLRWLLLVSVGLVTLVDVLVQGGALDLVALLPRLFVWTLAVLYNLAVMLWLLFGSPTPSLRTVTLGLDTLLTIGLVATSGGLGSTFLFFALFPILTAALCCRWFISPLIGLAVAVGGVLASPGLLPLDAARLLPFGAHALVLLLTALLSGLIGERVKASIARESALQSALQHQAEIQRLRAVHERTRLITQLASTLSATLNYSTVLDAMLEVSEAGMRELGQPNAVQISAVLLFGEKGLRVAASRHLPHRDQQVILPGRSGALAQALSTAESVIVDRPGDDPELGQLVAVHGCQRAAILPLRAGFETYGVAVFASSQPNIYTDDYLDLLMAICSQATIALQNARLYQSLIAEKERIVAVEEDARKKLARDLHDGPTQTIAAIAMRLNYIRTLQARDPERVSEELLQAEEMARRATKEIRQMLFALRPIILETQGLRAALEQYVNKIQETEPAAIHLDAPQGVDERLDASTQGVIFYILEEAIGNARKHARARNVWVRLFYDAKGDLNAEVEDDGSGFDVGEVEAHYDTRGSLGLLNMYERAELIGARLTIASQPGRGTRVRLVLPMEKVPHA